MNTRVETQTPTTPATVHPSVRPLKWISLALALAATSPALAQDGAANDVFGNVVEVEYPGVDNATLASNVQATSQAPSPGTMDVGLEPGEYTWQPELAPPGQLLVVVSLPTQLAHVYRNGIRIGVSTVSTGTRTNPTPTGTFEILQKKKINYSNLYNNAPMPFMQRLTWDGIALHAGKLPGYPASHGCIRLPEQFAELLYGETRKGMLVVIADELSHGPEVLYPGMQSPVDTYSGAPFQSADEGLVQGIASAP